MSDTPISYVANWLLENPLVAQYDAGDVCGLTGIPSVTLQNWANRKIITPKVSRPGKGGTRRYNKAELLWIKIARSLLPLGIEASAAIGSAQSATLELLNAITDRLEKKTPYSDDELVKSVLVIAADPLGRQQVVLLKPVDNKIYAKDVEIVTNSTAAIYVGIGKHLWELYKSDCTREIELSRK